MLGLGLGHAGCMWGRAQRERIVGGLTRRRQAVLLVVVVERRLSCRVESVAAGLAGVVYHWPNASHLDHGRRPSLRNIYDHAALRSLATTTLFC
jgi:hypothetical protein